MQQYQKNNVPTTFLNNILVMCLLAQYNCFTHNSISFTGVYDTMTLLLSCIVPFLYLYTDTLSIVTMYIYNNNNFPFAFSYIYHFHSYSLVIFLSSFLLPSIKCTKCEKIHVQYTKSTNCYKIMQYFQAHFYTDYRTSYGPTQAPKKCTILIILPLEGLLVFSFIPSTIIYILSTICTVMSVIQAQKAIFVFFQHVFQPFIRCTDSFSHSFLYILLNTNILPLTHMFLCTVQTCQLNISQDK